MTLDLINGAAAAATYTGLSRRMIYRLVESGHLPVVRLGRRLFFREGDLHRVFSAGAVSV